MKTKTLRTLALGMIASGIAFATPPFFMPIEDFFLNIPLALWLSGTFGISAIVSLLFTYTVVPAFLILTGIWIYPAKNGYIAHKIIKNIKKKTEKEVQKLKKDKVLALIYLVIGLALLKIYFNVLSQYFSI